MGKRNQKEAAEPQAPALQDESQEAAPEQAAPPALDASQEASSSQDEILHTHKFDKFK